MSGKSCELIMEAQGHFLKKKCMEKTQKKVQFGDFKEIKWAIILIIYPSLLPSKNIKPDHNDLKKKNLVKVKKTEFRLKTEKFHTWSLFGADNLAVATWSEYYITG